MHRIPNLTARSRTTHRTNQATISFKRQFSGTIFPGSEGNLVSLGDASQIWFTESTGMNVLSGLLVLAAHHGGDGAGAVFAAILSIVAAVIAIIGAMNKSQNTVWRNGLPYCPNCHRQISLKSSRSYCRSCGYNLVQSPQKPAPATPAVPSNVALLAQEAERKRRVKEQEELAERLRLIREQQERKAEAECQAKQAKAAWKAAKRQAAIKANGGYTDFQLISFGVGVILIPLSIIGLFVYLANH